MPRINFDLDQLAAFIAVADARSFRLAGERISLSPSAVSRRVERLEVLLGAQLFHRTTRHVELSRVGAAFLDKVRGSMSQLEQHALNIRELAESFRGEVSVACVPSVIPRLLAGPIAELQQQFPNAKVTVLDDTEARTLHHIASGSADFGLTFLSAGDAGLHCEHLVDDRYVAIVHPEHPLARRRTLRWEQLKGHALVVSGQISGNRQLINPALLQYGLQANIRVQTNRVTSVPLFARHNKCVGIVPALSLDLESRGDLKVIDLRQPTVSRAIGIFYPRNRVFNPAADYLYRCVRQSAREPAPAR